MKAVAEFKIHYRQILDPGGELVAPLPTFAQDAAEVLRMYEAMTLVRVFDAKAVNLQRTGQLGTYPSCLGHEAAHVGVGAAMILPCLDRTLPGASPSPHRRCMQPARPWPSRY